MGLAHRARGWCGKPVRARVGQPNARPPPLLHPHGSRGELDSASGTIMLWILESDRSGSRRTRQPPLSEMAADFCYPDERCASPPFAFFNVGPGTDARFLPSPSLILDQWTTILVHSSSWYSIPFPSGCPSPLAPPPRPHRVSDLLLVSDSRGMCFWSKLLTFAFMFLQLTLVGFSLHDGLSASSAVFARSKRQEEQLAEAFTEHNIGFGPVRLSPFLLASNPELTRGIFSFSLAPRSPNEGARNPAGRRRWSRKRCSSLLPLRNRSRISTISYHHTLARESEGSYVVYVPQCCCASSFSSLAQLIKANAGSSDLPSRVRFEELHKFTACLGFLSWGNLRVRIGDGATAGKTARERASEQRATDPSRFFPFLLGSNARHLSPSL